MLHVYHFICIFKSIFWYLFFYIVWEWHHADEHIYDQQSSILLATFDILPLTFSLHQLIDPCYPLRVHRTPTFLANASRSRHLWRCPRWMLRQTSSHRWWDLDHQCLLLGAIVVKRNGDEQSIEFIHYEQQRRDINEHGKV